MKCLLPTPTPHFSVYHPQAAKCVSIKHSWYPAPFWISNNPFRLLSVTSDCVHTHARPGLSLTFPKFTLLIGWSSSSNQCVYLQKQSTVIIKDSCKTFGSFGCQRKVLLLQMTVRCSWNKVEKLQNHFQLCMGNIVLPPLLTHCFTPLPNHQPDHNNFGRDAEPKNWAALSWLGIFLLFTTLPQFS